MTELRGGPCSRWFVFGRGLEVCSSRCSQRSPASAHPASPSALVKWCFLNPGRHAHVALNKEESLVNAQPALRRRTGPGRSLTAVTGSVRPACGPGAQLSGSTSADAPRKVSPREGGQRSPRPLGARLHWGPEPLWGDDSEVPSWCSSRGAQSLGRLPCRGRRPRGPREVRATPACPCSCPECSRG